MKFLLIAGFPDSIVKFRGPLIEALIEHGCQVHVAAPDLDVDPDIRTQLEGRGVRLHQIPLDRTGMNPARDMVSLVCLARLMRAIKPACVLGYTVKPVIYGTLAASFERVPRRYALITGLGYAFQEQGRAGLLTSVVRRLYKLALRRAHKVFFQNPDDEALFRSLGILGTDASSRVVNGSGVDTMEYALAPLPDEPRFLMIARLLRSKGVREYAEAARLLKRSNPEVVCALAGWIDRNPDAIGQEELDGWIAEGTITYLGRLADVRPAIAQSSVYVLPSYREGTPRTVLEAMSMGRPIITTDTAGCRQTVVDGENGFLVAVKSADGLAAAMGRFVKDPALSRRMGQRSRALAEEKFDVRAVNSTMLSEMGIA